MNNFNQRLRRFCEVHFGMAPGEHWGDFAWSAVIGILAAFGIASFIVGLILQRIFSH